MDMTQSIIVCHINDPMSVDYSPSIISDIICLCLLLQEFVNFNPFLNDKLKTLLNWKSLQTTNLNLMNIAEKFSESGRKQCGKRRNCSLRAISPFPKVFSKDLYCTHVKTRPHANKTFFMLKSAYSPAMFFTLWKANLILFLFSNVYFVFWKYFQFWPR